jgi:hypothetical protein
MTSHTGSGTRLRSGGTGFAAYRRHNPVRVHQLQITTYYVRRGRRAMRISPGEYGTDLKLVRQPEWWISQQLAVERATGAGSSQESKGNPDVQGDCSGASVRWRLLPGRVQVFVEGPNFKNARMSSPSLKPENSQGGATRWRGVQQLTWRGHSHGRPVSSNRCGQKSLNGNAGALRQRRLPSGMVHVRGRLGCLDRCLNSSRR